MTPRARRFLNPFYPNVGVDLVHVLLALCLVASGIVIGVLGQRAQHEQAVIQKVQKYRKSARYFHRLYGANLLAVPKGSQRVPVMPGVANLPATGVINSLTSYPHPLDQGPVGACAGWATAQYATWSARVNHLSTRHWRASPKAPYDAYISRYFSGRDLGSDLVTDVALMDQFGWPSFRSDPYPPYVLGDGHGNFALPPDAQASAAKHRYQFQVQVLSGLPGGGQGAVDAVKVGISQGLPVAAAIPVGDDFYGATDTGGTIAHVPNPNPDGSMSGTDYGGHEVVFLKYSDQRQAFYGQTNWAGYGIAGDYGHFWLPYRYVALYAWQIAVMRPTGTSAGYFPPARAFGIRDRLNIIASPYWYEPGVVSGRAPVQDTDYILPFAAHRRVHVPGGWRAHYWLMATGYVYGSGCFQTWGTGNHGRVAFLHLVGHPGSCAGHWRLYQRVHGGTVVGTSGWPSSTTYSNNSCYDWTSCESDAHLCLVTDYLGSVWLYRVTHTGVRASPQAGAVPSPPLPAVLPATLSTSAPGPTYSAPSLPPSSSTGARHGGYWVHRLRLKDTRIDLTRAVNRAGQRYGIWPLGIAALIGTESNFLQRPTPRYGSGCDVSFGVVQVTVCTAGVYGLGDGQLTAANIAYVRSYEELRPRAMIDIAARILRDARRASCERFVALYVAYNAGPYLGCGAYFYEHPTGIAASNLINYRGWLTYSRARFG